MASGRSIAHLARLYGAVIFFPSFTVVTIYADWSHTRDWKQKQKLLEHDEQLKQ